MRQMVCSVTDAAAASAGGHAEHSRNRLSSWRSSTRGRVCKIARFCCAAPLAETGSYVCWHTACWAAQPRVCQLGQPVRQPARHELERHAASPCFCPLSCCADLASMAAAASWTHAASRHDAHGCTNANAAAAIVGCIGGQVWAGCSCTDSPAGALSAASCTSSKACTRRSCPGDRLTLHDLLQDAMWKVQEHI